MKTPPSGQDTNLVILSNERQVGVTTAWQATFEKQLFFLSCNKYSLQFSEYFDVQMYIFLHSMSLIKTKTKTGEYFVTHFYQSFDMFIFYRTSLCLGSTMLYTHTKETSILIKCQSNNTAWSELKCWIKYLLWLDLHNSNF